MHREAHWAGRFYTAEPSLLEGEVAEMLAQGGAGGPSPWALIVPHAGYVYSGATAAAAYAELDPKQVNRVILIGPAHHTAVNGFALSRAESWRTPIGDMAVDVDAVDTLAALGDPWRINEAALAIEHSLEVQIPFLVHRLKGAVLLPIVMGRARAEDRRTCLEHLREIAREGDLWVISTDLSHFHARDAAEKLDAAAAALIEAGDEAAFSSALDQGNIEACGAGPLKLLLSERERRGGSIRIVDRRDSSLASGDEEQVVGYLAAVCHEGAADD